MGNKLPPIDPLYPEDDGLPRSESTLQFDWMVKLYLNLKALFADDPNVLVAGNLLWYPVEGDPTVHTAPDAMVVFGRPPVPRRAYIQYREGDIAPQVVFEIASHLTTAATLAEKLEFYDRYGVEEYYLYDPHKLVANGWRRQGTNLRPIPAMDGWTSPRLGVRFDLSQEELRLLGPDGRRFVTDAEALRETEEFNKQAEFHKARRLRAEERIRRYSARLRALGHDPDAEAP
jgi:Uma2 family endonuclease